MAGTVRTGVDCGSLAQAHASSVDELRGLTEAIRASNPKLRTGNDGSQLIATLQGSTKTEHASCGKVQNVAYCVIPLSGGNITLNGTDQTTVADLGKLADQLYASLA